VVYAVGTQDVTQVSERITDKVKKVIPLVVSLVLKEMGPQAQLRPILEEPETDTREMKPAMPFSC